MTPSSQLTAAADPVHAAFPYLSRTKHRGLDEDCDEVQDLIQRLKDGDTRAAKVVARTLSKHPRLRGFSGVVVPAPRSQGGRPSLITLASELVASGVGDRVERAVVRKTPVESSRKRRQRGLHGIPEQDHYDTMGVVGGISPDEPILIVDDLVTTGSTLRAAAKRLRSSGHKAPILLAAAAYNEPNPGEVRRCPISYISKASSQRVAARWAKAQANWTLPYLEKLIETAVSDPTGWGESSPAARVLRQMVKSSGFGNLDPFPVDEVWDYLASHDVDSDEIAVLKKVRPPRARERKVGPTLIEAYRLFDQETGKRIIFKNIDLDTDHHLAPALLAITKAVSKLPKRSARLWQSEVKKVMLVGRNTGTEEASWKVGGVMALSLGKGARSVPLWRGTLVHELGHALEDKLGLTLTPWDDTPYGQPPFTSNYADTNASEDFAETFKALEMEPSHLRRVVPAKYEDMKGRF